jgi:hypothetical protein
MLVKRYGNLIVGLFFMGLATTYYFLASGLPSSQVGSLGPRFVPNIIAGITFVTALLLIAASVKKLVKMPDAAEEEKSIEYRRVLLTMAAFCIYVYSFGSLGFLVATFIYLMAQMIIFAPREKINLPLFFVISLVTSGLVYFLFRYRLDVMLPQGILNI